MRISSRLRPRQLTTIAGLVFALSGALVAQLVSQAAAAPSELFLSEYVEGSSSNKALEVFNGTGASVTLAGRYDIQIFANGSPTPTATIALTGTVADGDVFVLARSSAVAAILAAADQTTTNFLFNGDDAVALRRDGTIVDVIGQIGVDPGVEWRSGDTSTLDRTLTRKPTIRSGDTNGADGFDPAVEWDGSPIDTFGGLGAHSLSSSGGGTGGGTGGAGTVDAVADSATVLEDEASTIDVLVNDAGSALSVAGVAEPGYGSATVTADGRSIVYVPDVDFAGTDSFTYVASDGLGGTDSAAVTVTVEPVNDDPEPEDDAATTPEDTAIVVDVLVNDTDPEGEALTVTGVDGAERGTATVLEGGAQIRYEPDPDSSGTDGFEYTVADASGGVETAEVLVSVTAVDDPPRARDDAAVVTEGATVVIDVLANDAPGPADESGQTLAVTSVGAAGGGLAELIATGPDAGRIRYTPAAGYTGADSFTYVVSDGTSAASGSVSVTVHQAVLRTLCGLTPTIAGTRGATSSSARRATT